MPRHEILVLADGEASYLGQSWPLLQLLKAPRHGVIVQPDEGDGELVFKTPLGRLRRNDFPFGRGVYVRRGSFVRVQCAVVG